MNDQGQIELWDRKTGVNLSNFPAFPDKDICTGISWSNYTLDPVVDKATSTQGGQNLAILDQYDDPA